MRKKPGFTCRICHKTYRRKGYLIKHLEKVHKQHGNEAEKKQADDELEKNQTAEKIIQTKMDNFSEDSCEHGDEERDFKNDLVVSSKMLKTSMTKSDSSLKTRDFFELEINLEYDIVTKGKQVIGGTPKKIIKKDLFSGLIKLPKAFAKNFINNQMFGEIKFDNKKITAADTKKAKKSLEK